MHPGPRERLSVMNRLEEIRQALRESAALKEQIAKDLAPVILKVAEALASALDHGGKVLLCGNGGSAADAQHIAAELVGRFERTRPGLAAIALTTDTSILTAVGNDFGFEEIFARQVEALARPGDLVVGISTSGRSENVRRALERGRERGATTVALLGGDGGSIAPAADFALVVPSRVTSRIQEAHITIGHILCEAIEAERAGPQAKGPPCGTS